MPRVDTGGKAWLQHTDLHAGIEGSVHFGFDVNDLPNTGKHREEKGQEVSGGRGPQVCRAHAPVLSSSLLRCQMSKCVSLAIAIENRMATGSLHPDQHLTRGRCAQDLAASWAGSRALEGIRVGELQHSAALPQPHTQPRERAESGTFT